MPDDFDILNRLLVARHSCRSFRPDPVPDETIARIVNAAGRAPSWCNAQPWQVTVTRGQATDRFRAALLETVASDKPAPDLPWPDGYPGAYGARRRECGLQLYEAVGIERGDRAGRAQQSLQNYQLFGAPHVAIVHSEAELGPYGAMDTGGFVTAFTLAAVAMGVATIAQASVAAYPAMIRSHFDLPDNRLILCAISFGYADTDHPANNFRTTRAGLEDIYDPRG
ncbi:NADH dehydrogenase [Roseovarius litorisediminis]|uniref:NADH dehydrogenase n=1 Tax=Roseovarius litorisediminis TaxID=1312363 RepID=A0A1Y5S784_9RHOB|nr:nitroreductase [Roseovarius litorisediminis]SLN32755.1 NADH dehydrogenase [Roseovarius litorisediminis]